MATNKNGKRKLHRGLRIESLEQRQMMAGDFSTSYQIDRHDIGGVGETALVGDFNGDGLADIGVYIPNGHTDARWVVKFNQGNGTFKSGSHYDIDRRDIGGVGEIPLVGDFNGDGRDDLGVYIPNGHTDARWVVKFNQGNGNFKSGSHYDIDRRDIGGVGETPLVGDFNGDHRADLGVYIPNGTKDARWVAKYNQGNGSFKSGNHYDIDRRDIGGVGETPLVGDFNGDHRADLGVYIPNGTKDARWVVKFNQGNGNFKSGADYNIDRHDIGGVGETPLIGDFKNDHRADIALYIPNGNRDARWVAKQAQDWSSATLHDTALRSLTATEANDGVLSRADMLSLFRQVEQDGKVSGTEFADLKLIVDNSSLFTPDRYVEQLAQDVVDGNVANADFQGRALGNLVAGNHAAKLDTLVDKWFMGADHPESNIAVSISGTAVSVPRNTYQVAAGTLFGSKGPQIEDVDQGMLGDCFLMAPLAETALQDPKAIRNMFIDNGDGTFTVRFFRDGSPVYVTVDRALPVDAVGNFVFDSQTKAAPNVLWVQLAEKAYAQLAELGWSRAYAGMSANSYGDIDSGFADFSLDQIVGKGGVSTPINNSDFSQVAAAWQTGHLVCFVTPPDPADSRVAENHVYAVVGFDVKAHTIKLFNPWGVDNTSLPAYVTLNWNDVHRSFDEIDVSIR